jgi:hypothetical protein
MDKSLPISSMVAEGWEVVQMTTFVETLGRPVHTFLMRKDGQHKLVKFFTKAIGKGLAIEVVEV